jgi:hypothetical protein
MRVAAPIICPVRKDAIKFATAPAHFAAQSLEEVNKPVSNARI